MPRKQNSPALPAKQLNGRQERRASFSGYLYLLPALVFFLIFTVYPFLKTIVQSLFSTSTTGELIGFIGLENYIDIFTDPSYLQSFKSTLIFTAVSVPLTVLCSLILAVLSSGDQKGMGIFRTIFTSTMGVSVAAGSVFWSFLFNPSVGVLNKLLGLFGIAPVSWLTDPGTAIYAIAAISAWTNSGFSYLILVGGLKNIDPSYYEYVDLVGGGFWYRLRKVTIPLLSPSLFFVVTISLINAFQTFGVVDMLTHGGPVNTTRLLVYRLYVDAFTNFRYGLAGAQGIILFALIFLISRIQTRFTERMVTYQ
jgi:sn-glycerol 3-phosphate transport system permease protein